MLCPSCNTEKDKKDFFNKDKCYKCIYAEKTIQVTCKKCVVCGKYSSPGRLKYCSDICMKLIAKKKKKEYWTKRLA